MNTFNAFFNSFINESIVDIPRNSLDPTVFEFPDDGPPIMHPIIKTQIMSDIDKFRELVPVVTYFAVGSILTKQYTAHSDIDINVQIDAPKDRVLESVFELMKRLNGRMASGTTHPINYYVIQEDYDLDKTVAAYDIVSERWIKEPKIVNVSSEDYMQKFQNSVNGIDFGTSELRRNIIDYETLKSMDGDNIKDLNTKMQAKLDKIENNIEALLRSYKNVKTLRKNAFEKEMSPAEIRKYGEKNKLPENIIYKMLERYYYFDFIKELKRVMEDDKVSDKDISDIKSAGKEFWK